MASLQSSDSSNALLPVGPADDVDTLLGALGARDAAARTVALEALRALEPAHVLCNRLTDGTQSLTTRKQVAVAMRLLKLDATVPALVWALSKDPAPAVRAEAAFALSMFGAAKAERALVGALGDVCDDVRYYAADALGSVRSAKAKAALVARAEVEHHMAVQIAIRSALGKHH